MHLRAHKKLALSGCMMYAMQDLLRLMPSANAVPVHPPWLHRVTMQRDHAWQSKHTHPVACRSCGKRLDNGYQSMLEGVLRAS